MSQKLSALVIIILLAGMIPPSFSEQPTPTIQQSGDNRGFADMGERTNVDHLLAELNTGSDIDGDGSIGSIGLGGTRLSINCKLLDPTAIVTPSTKTCDVHNITINAGQTLRIGHGVTLIVENSFTNNGKVFDGGTIDLNGGSIKLGGTSLLIINDGTINLNGGILDVGGNSKEIFSGDSFFIISGNVQETYSGDITLYTNGNFKKTVNGDENIIINGKRTETVNGDEFITIHGDRSETVNGNEKITVNGKRTQTVGHDQFTIINDKGTEKITIHGGGDMSVTIQHDEALWIHGSRTETVNGNEKITVKHDRTETVGGHETITVNGKRTQTVGHDEKISVGGSRTETVGPHGKEIIGGGSTLIIGNSQLKVHQAGTLLHELGHTFGLDHGGTVTVDKDGTIINKGIIDIKGLMTNNGNVNNPGSIIADCGGIFSGNPPTGNQVIVQCLGSPQASILAFPASPVVGDTVHLSATINDPGCLSCTPFAYQWSFSSRPLGSSALLSNPTDPTPFFIPELPGNYKVSLVVTDTLGNTSPTTYLSISSSSCGTCIPVVSPTALPNPALVGDVVTLNANPSDAGCQSCIPLFTYHWQMTSAPPGSTAALSSTTVQNPTIKPDTAGLWVFQLRATDSGAQDSVPAFLTLTVKQTNTPPQVSILASPNPAVVGTPETLSATITDPTCLACTFVYHWTLVDPIGSSALLSDPTAPSPTFTPDLPGSYQVSVVATDSFGLSSAPGFTSITVTNPTPPPDFSLSANPTSISITAGGSSGTSTISVAPLNGFNSNTALSVSGAPTGAVATLSLSSIPGGSGSSTLSIFASPSVAPGNYAITVSGAGGGSSHSVLIALSIAHASPPPITPVITAPSTVTSGKSYFATVQARSGMHYSWTITDGTITSPGGTSGVTTGGINSISFTAGSAPGPLTISATETNGAGDSSAPGTANATIYPSPITPIIIVPSTLAPGQTYTASVPARSGMTYSWTITDGTITSPGGTSGVTTGGINSISFTAGSAPGPLTISATETNGAGDSSAPGNITIPVATQPGCPPGFIDNGGGVCIPVA